MKTKYNGFDIEIILIMPAGSRLYGNSRPQSDWDYRGVFILNKKHKLSLNENCEQIEESKFFDKLNEEFNLGLKDTSDCVLYELTRFAKLALDNNPNILDTLCGNLENSIYHTEKGRKLLDAQGLFLSKKSKFTFSGYAVAQLKRIKGHNKWINQFPHTDEVLKVLYKEYNHNKSVNWDWLVENFGGQVAEKVTGETAQEHQNFESKVTYDEFKKFVPNLDLDKYRVPRLVDYMKAYDLTHSQLDMNTFFVSKDGRMSKDKLKDFLQTEAAFRKFGESVLAVYTGGRGLFGREGNLKANDSEFLGNFVCLVSVDHNNYKKDKDHVNAMWHWKVNRNEKRGVLEEQFGFDTKHGSHLVRLMEGAKDLLLTGKYTPELSGERLQIVNDVRDGKYSYEYLINYAEKLDLELDELYKNSSLRNKPDHKGVNDLVLELQND